MFFKKKPEIILIRPASHNVQFYINDIRDVFGDNVQEESAYYSALHWLRSRRNNYKVVIIGDYYDCDLEAMKRFIKELKRSNNELLIICITFSVERLIEAGLRQVIDDDCLFHINVKKTVLASKIKPYLNEKSP